MTGSIRQLPASTSRTPTGATGFAAAVACAAIGSVALSAVIAAIAHSAGVSHSFKALHLATYTPFIIVGLLAGATAWNLIRNKAAEPARLLTWLAPTVVLVSFVPDVIVGAAGTLPGSSWGGVSALMGMHLVVAACGIASFRIFLPLRPTPTAQDGETVAKAGV